jgi:hypothetical protein
MTICLEYSSRALGDLWSSSEHAFHTLVQLNFKKLSQIIDSEPPGIPKNIDSVSDHLICTNIRNLLNKVINTDAFGVKLDSKSTILSRAQMEELLNAAEKKIASIFGLQSNLQKSDVASWSSKIEFQLVSCYRSVRDVQILAVCQTEYVRKILNCQFQVKIVTIFIRKHVILSVWFR